MAIKIRKDGVVQDLVINANEVRVLDKDGNFKSKNLETILKQIATTGTGGSGTGGSGYPSDAEFVYVKDTEPDMDGVWLDESDVTSDDSSVGSNSVVKEIKSYVNSETSKINASLTNAKAELEEKDAELLNKIGILNNGVNQISNPNLLINGDFQVWQRGTTATIPTGGRSGYYGPDRWKFTCNLTKNITISKSDSGNLKIEIPEGTTESPGSNLNYLLSTIQIMETPPKIGQEYSLSIKFKQSVPNALRAPGGTSDVINDYVILKYNTVWNGGNYVWFDILKPATIEVEYVKLELGSVVTPFVPRKYAEELNLCKRYYQIIRFGGHCTHETHLLPCVTNFPVPMRVVPSFELNYIGQGKNKMDCFGAGEMQFDEMIAFLDTSHLFYLQDNAPVKQMIIGKYYDSFAILDAEIY